MSTSDVIGGIAAMDIAHSTSPAGNQGDYGPLHSSNQATNQSKHVVVQHINEAAANLSSNQTTTHDSTTSGLSNTVTLVATPKTMAWSTIVVLLTLGIVGLVVVLVYSIVRPGTPE